MRSIRLRRRPDVASASPGSDSDPSGGPAPAEIDIPRALLPADHRHRVERPALLAAAPERRAPTLLRRPGRRASARRRRRGGHRSLHGLRAGGRRSDQRALQRRHLRGAARRPGSEDRARRPSLPPLAVGRLGRAGGAHSAVRRGVLRRPPPGRHEWPRLGVRAVPPRRLLRPRPLADAVRAQLRRRAGAGRAGAPGPAARRRPAAPRGRLRPHPDQLARARRDARRGEAGRAGHRTDARPGGQGRCDRAADRGRRRASGGSAGRRTRIRC